MNSRSRSRSPGQENSRPYSRSRSRSADKQGCRRCGNKLHDGKHCTVYAFCETKCRVCNLFHRTQWCNQKKGRKLEANLVEVKDTDTGVVASNMIDLDWEDEGKNGSEVLTSLTALPEWSDLI